MIRAYLIVSAIIFFMVMLVSFLGKDRTPGKIVDGFFTLAMFLWAFYLLVR